MNEPVKPETFDAVDKRWGDLLPCSQTNTVFLLPLWQRLWWELLGGDAELHLLTVEHNQQLLGIAPLMSSNSIISFLGGTDLFDYHDFIVLKGQEQKFYSLLVEYLSNQNWTEVVLRSLPEGSPTLHLLPELARSQGWICEVKQEDVVPGLCLPQDWDQYLSGLSKRDRHELRRKFRRLHAYGSVEHFTCQDPSTLPEQLNEFFKLMRASREDKRGFLTPEREEFLKALATGMMSENILRLDFLQVDGKSVAGTMCFDYGNQRLLYNSGFDPNYKHLSVGILLKAMTMDIAIIKGIRYYDFLRGDEPYKHDLGAVDRYLYQLLITRQKNSYSTFTSK